MAKRIGQISINISAGTAQFVLDMEKANATVKKFGADATGSMRGAGNATKELGSHTVTSMQASSAAIREAFGGSNIRAVERFLATTVGLGPILQKLFPLVGGAAFL